MRTLTIIITSLLYIGCLSTEAQVFYASKEFKQKGVIEYLSIWGELVHYWTNVRKTDVKLTCTGRESLGWDKVYFPNDPAKYKLNFKGKDMVLHHPDGEIQIFKRLSFVYCSNGFERKGVVEFLEVAENDQTFLYYTSQNKAKKIKLHNLGKTVFDSKGYRFPNSSIVYKILMSNKCGGAIFCMHPDGRKQYFKSYDWK